MKKFVTFLTVGYCMLICSNNLFSSVYFNNPDKISLMEHSANEGANVANLAADCGTVSGFAFFATDGTAPVNGQGCVDIVSQQFNDILLFQWTMEINSTVATYSHVNIVNLPDTVYTSQPSGPNSITVSWQSESFQGINVPDCEVLFQICFDAVGADGTLTPVRFTGSETPFEVRTEDGTLLNPDYYDGSLTIDSNAKPPVSLNIQGTQLEENQSACLPVSASGFTGITNVITSHTWDPNVLQLDQITGFNLPGLDANDFTINVAAGTAVLNWSSNGSSGETVADGTNIYDLCFTAIGTPGSSSAVSTSNTPTSSSVTNAAGDNLTFSLSTTNVGIISPPGACGSINGLSFYASAESVEPGGNTCVAISASDFENVLSFGWSMAYDSTIIELDTAYAVSLPAGSFKWGRNIQSQNIGVPGPGILGSNFQFPTGTNKVITISWFEPGFAGLTFTECKTLFNLCFTAVGPIGQTSPVLFVDRPTPVEVGDPNFNVLLNSITPFESGSVKIEEQQQVSGFEIKMGDTNIEEGGTGCIPIKVNGFSKIKEYKSSFAWDANHLAFLEVRGFNLTGLDANDFITSGTSTGSLAVEWNSNTAVTLPNNSTLFEICFQANGASSTVTSLEVVDSPVVSEATNEAGDNLTFVKGKADITIVEPAGLCGSIPGLSFYGSVECAEPSDKVCVEVSAANVNNMMSFGWSMAYDSTVIELDTAYAVSLPAGSFRWGRNIQSQNIGIPSQAILGSSFQYPSGTNKVITVSWFEPGFAGLTFTECETLFNLCFDAIGSGGQSSPVIFTDRPTQVEVGDPDFNVLLNNITPFEDGRVDIKTSCSGPPPPAPDVPLPSNVSITDVNCKGTSTGAIDLTFATVTSGLTFMWTPGNVNTMDLDNAMAGTYSLNISNGSKDTTLTYTVSEPQSELNGSVGDVVQIKCNGSGDGAISIVVNGGTANYSFDWNAPLPGDMVQENLSAGAYTVTVMDANGCTDVVGPIAITEPQPIQIVESITNVNCAGRSNGRISLSPTGGTPGGLGYSYDWSSGTPTATQNNIPKGTYSVTVSDANNCSTTGTYTVDEESPINIMLGSGGIAGEANGNDGSIDIDVSGGVLNGLPDYVYIWSPSTQSQITQDAVNLAAGQHTVTVTDAVQCESTSTFTVDFVGPEYMTGDVIVTDACVGESNGTITVNFTGGLNPQISWNSPTGGGPYPSTFKLAGLLPGLYQYTITDGGVEVDSDRAIVGIHAALNITAVINDEIFGNDGSITLNPLNGVGPYSYQWSNNETTKDISGLQRGIYEVLITDNGTGCSNTATFTVADRRPVVLGQLNSNDSRCPGEGSGTLEFEITQGVPPFEVKIIGTAINDVINNAAPTTYSTTGLPAGSYTLIVTDANSSVSNKMFTITEPAAFAVIPTIYPATTTEPGRIQLNITGGTPGYSVNWGNGIDPNNLQPGNYTGTVTDANGCTFTTASYSVTRFRIIDTDITDASCVDATNGSAEITVEGGNLPYTYLWKDGQNNDISTTNSVTNRPSGAVSVTIIDNVGVRITANYTIAEQSTITSTGTLTTNFGGFNVSCNGGNDGRARVNATDGQAPYSYLWEDGQMTQEAIDLPAGVSSVTVTDNVGCTSITEVTLTAPTPIVINEQVIETKCFGEVNGEIRLFLTGGIQYPSAERYIFQWDEISFTPGPTVRNVAPGTYPITVEDANGCQVRKDIVVSGPTAPLKAMVPTEPADENCNGSARAEVTGGTSPYFYNWYNRLQADSSDRELLGLCSGTYLLNVTDANGCTTTASGNVGNTSIECLTTRAVITPDGGGLNEEFIIWCIEQYPDNTLEIYNRWGQLVWEQDDYDNTWNGKTMRGGDVPDGAYFYVFRYTSDNEIRQTKGSFTLLRE